MEKGPDFKKPQAPKKKKFKLFGNESKETIPKVTKTESETHRKETIPKVTKTESESHRAEDVDERKEERKVLRDAVFSTKVLTPAGNPPCKPNGYTPSVDTPWIRSSDPWESTPTDEDVVVWAHKCIDLYDKKEGGILLPEAVVYYARHFWDIHSDEYRNRIKPLILDELSN